MKKYYFGRLSVESSATEVETSFLIAKEGESSIQKLVDEFEKNFYADSTYNEESDMYESDYGEFAYTGVSYNEITEAEYEVMSKYLHTHNLGG